VPDHTADTWRCEFGGKSTPETAGSARSSRPVGGAATRGRSFSSTMWSPLPGTAHPTRRTCVCCARLTICCMHESVLEKGRSRQRSRSGMGALGLDRDDGSGVGHERRRAVRSTQTTLHVLCHGDGRRGECRLGFCRLKADRKVVLREPPNVPSPPRAPSRDASSGLVSYWAAWAKLRRASHWPVPT